jgi:UDP-N-acetylglucosamine 4,6-dehydratase/5-epimerase
MFENKIILITGGTGSFGNAVVNKFISTKIKEIRIFSRDEKKQETMRLKIANKKLKFYIGDVKDINSLNNAMESVDYVFHAAALKQVPSCEFYPMEAVKSNVLGAENVIESSIRFGIKRVVMLSTDKAVYPVNAMGLTKALMEKITIARARIIGNVSTIFCTTRYGNVMASRGSVIPLFINQIQNKQPITITDPEMTRFLMSLEESVELVLYAFKNGKQGDIFVQKSPAATVRNLAKSLCKYFNHDGQIKNIGTRHGEKLFETLVSREEMAKAESIGNYYRIPMDNRDLNYASYFSEGQKQITVNDDYTSHNTHLLDEGEILDIIKNLKYIREKQYV